MQVFSKATHPNCLVDLVHGNHIGGLVVVHTLILGPLPDFGNSFLEGAAQMIQG